jgi:negative regulator of flagellin synthesis FlgM
MANDISGIGRGPGSPRTSGPQGPSNERSGPAARANEAAPASSADRVSLTGGAEALQQAEATAREATGVDPARVAEIRDAITEGRYRIDTARLAERLIADEKLLG